MERAAARDYWGLENNRPRRYQSGLETVPRTQPGLEVDPYTNFSANNADTARGSSTTEQEAQKCDPVYEDPRPRTILGLSVGIFWAIVVLLCVIFAGGIGGGVGAGLAAMKNKCPR